MAAGRDHAASLGPGGEEGEVLHSLKQLRLILTPSPGNGMDTGRKKIQKIFINLQKYVDNDGLSGAPARRMVTGWRRCPAFLWSTLA